MKINLLCIIILVSAWTFAQSPQSMNYQAVVRNAAGELVANKNIGTQISILNGGESGDIVYSETQVVSTNDNGLLTLTIGNGTSTAGTFNNIDWGNGEKFIKTEMDLDGGSSYTLSITSQLASVPYALYAANSGSDNPATERLSLSNGIILIDGASTNTTALDAGMSTTIDFSKSNLAYTAASAQPFILEGIKDGGTYTLAVQGNTEGLAEFSADGFVFKSKNNNITTASTDTLYSFLVMGTTVYFTMTTGL